MDDKIKNGNKITFNDFIIVLLLLLSEFRILISSDLAIAMAFAFIILLFLIAYLKKIKTVKNIKQIKSTVFFALFNLLIIFIQSFYLPFTNSTIKHIIGFLVLLIFTFVFDGSEFKSLKLAIKTMCFILAIDMLIKVPIIISSGRAFAEIRYFTLLDKGYYTFWFTLLNILVWYEFLNKKGSKIGFLLTLLIDVFLFLFMETKILLIIPIMMVITFYSKLKFKNKLIFIIIFIFCFIMALSSFSNIEKMMPAYIVNFNNFIKNGLGGIENVGSARTYFLRTEIINNCIDIIKTNPFGIGYGNYLYYAMNVKGPLFINQVIVETESSYLNLLVEGGIVAFAIDILFMLKLFIKSFKQKTYCTKLACLLIVGLVTLNCINDFMTITYWIVLSCIISIVINDNKNEQEMITNEK